jgi:hypothetical protein
MHVRGIIFTGSHPASASPSEMLAVGARKCGGHIAKSLHS